MCESSLVGSCWAVLRTGEGMGLERKVGLRGPLTSSPTWLGSRPWDQVPDLSYFDYVCDLRRTWAWATPPWNCYRSHPLSLLCLADPASISSNSTGQLECWGDSQCSERAETWTWESGLHVRIPALPLSSCKTLNLSLPLNPFPHLQNEIIGVVSIKCEKWSTHILRSRSSVSEMQ